MANQITGTIQSIGPTLNIASKDNSRTFQRREIILDASRYDQFTGEKFENSIMLEFGGAKCQLLDNFRIGQLVTISFTLSGRNYTKPDGTQSNFTRVQGYAIEERHTQAPQTVSMPTQLPSSINPTQASAPAPTSAPMASSAAPAPTASQPETNISPDDLPF